MWISTKGHRLRYNVCFNFARKWKHPRTNTRNKKKHRCHVETVYDQIATLFRYSFHRNAPHIAISLIIIRLLNRWNSNLSTKIMVTKFNTLYLRCFSENRPRCVQKQLSNSTPEFAAQDYAPNQPWRLECWLVFSDCLVHPPIKSVLLMELFGMRGFCVLCEIQRVNEIDRQSERQRQSERATARW